MVRSRISALVRSWMSDSLKSGSRSSSNMNLRLSLTSAAMGAGRYGISDALEALCRAARRKERPGEKPAARWGPRATASRASPTSARRPPLLHPGVHS